MLEEGPTLGAFALGEPLGSGAMARVWRGAHRSTDTPVALKVLDGDPARGSDFVATFRNEVGAVARLAHPGVVTIHDCGEVTEAEAERSGGLFKPGSPWIAMELVDGGPLPVARTAFPVLRDRLRQVLAALAHAHAHGIVHRDVKPGNILLDPHGYTKLTDFGIAAQLDQATPSTPATPTADDVQGTPLYMAPEQFGGGGAATHGPFTDLYAVGCIAWQLAAGRPPFEHANILALVRAHLMTPPPQLPDDADAPAGFGAWTRRLMAKDPFDRYPRADEALAALDELSGKRPRPPVRLPRAPRTPERRPALPGTGLGLFGLRPPPIVGRGAQQDGLWRSLSKVARQGRGRAVVLAGPEGCGRSRLLAWVAAEADETCGFQVLRARSASLGEPGDALRRLVTRHLACAGQPPDLVRSRLDAHLDSLGGASGDSRAELAALIAPADEEGSLKLTSPAERHHAVLAFVERLARQRPVLIVLDDVQHDPDVLGFVRHFAMAQSHRPCRALVVAAVRTFRSDLGAAASLEDLPNTKLLPLEPLDRDALRELTHGVLGLAPALAQRVEDRGGGNPMLTIELIGDQVAQGVLVPGPNGFELAGGARLRLPASVHGLWSRRVDRLLRRLPDGSLLALEAMAALGELVDAQDWRAVCAEAGAPPPPELLPALVAHGLAHARGSSWSLGSSLLEESVARRSRDEGRWPLIQRACASVLEGRLPPTRGRDARVGAHLLAAGEPSAAWERLAAAIEAALEADEHAEADRLLDLGDEALAAMGAPDDGLRVARARRLRAQVCMDLGRYGEVVPLLEQIEAVAKGRRSAGWHGALARATHLRALVERREGDFDAAEAHLDVAEAIATRLGDEHLVAKCSVVLAWISRERGDGPEARRRFKLALRRCRDVRDASATLECLRGLAEQERRSGNIIGSLALYQRAVDWGTQMGTRRAVAGVLLAMAQVELGRGDAEAALSLATRGVQLRERLGNPEHLGSAINAVGDILRNLGRNDEAEAAYRRCLQLYGDSPHRFLPLTNIGMSELARGRYAQAEEALAAAVRESARRPRWPFPEIVWGLLAPCLAHRGDWSALGANLSSSRRLLSERRLTDPDLAWAYGLTARLCHEAGRRDDARRSCELAADLWDALGNADKAERARAAADRLG